MTTKTETLVDRARLTEEDYAKYPMSCPANFRDSWCGVHGRGFSDCMIENEREGQLAKALQTFGGWLREWADEYLDPGTPSTHGWDVPLLQLAQEIELMTEAAGMERPDDT